MPTNFNELSGAEIIAFIGENFGSFSSVRDEQFPAGLVGGVESGDILIEKCPEGFALAYRGRLFVASPGGIPADLLFLYVAPEFEGRGFGAGLIARVKLNVTAGVPLILVCEGQRRRSYFEKHGFTVEFADATEDVYEMRFTPVST